MPTYHFTREQLDKLLSGTIEMMIEYRDNHGHEEDYAADVAVMEMLAGLDADELSVGNDTTEHLQLPE